MKIVNLFISLYFILYPFYFFKSGTIQLSDIFPILALVVLIILREGKIKLKQSSFLTIKKLLFFVTYVTINNLIWMFFLDSGSIKFTTILFYWYNFLLFSLFTILGDNDRNSLLLTIFRSLIFSQIIQLFIFVKYGGFALSRMRLYFNNPNQLGYYSLLSLVLLIYIYGEVEIKQFYFFAGIMMSLVFVLGSLSTSAMLSIVSILFFIFLIKFKLNKEFLIRAIKVVVFIFVSIFMLTTTKLNQVFSNNIKRVENRLNRSKSKLDLLSIERGYYRLKLPQYWIFGAGEGGYLERFGSRLEFHSMFGNIQVSYGIIGTYLFIRFLYSVFSRKKTIAKLLLLSILIYGLTHNNIRYGLLWVFFSIVATEEKSVYYEAKT